MSKIKDFKELEDFLAKWIDYVDYDIYAGTPGKFSRGKAKTIVNKLKKEFKWK